MTFFFFTKLLYKQDNIKQTGHYWLIKTYRVIQDWSALCYLFITTVYYISVTLAYQSAS